MTNLTFVVYLYLSVLFFQLYYHLNTRTNTTTKIVLYDSHHKFGHKYICRDMHLGKRIKLVLTIISYVLI